MPARKGTRPPAAGVARRKGIPNKITRDMRELIAAFVDNNMDGAQALYDRVARHHPYRALTILNRFVEFVCPKMNRVEVTATSAPIDKPIESVADAARVYELLMRDRTLDVSKIKYVDPASVVAEQESAA